MPNCTNKNIGWLWINGTAEDPTDSKHPYYSGINGVEIWKNGTYMGDAVLSKQHAKSVKWWWRTDPSKNPKLLEARKMVLCGR